MWMFSRTTKSKKPRTLQNKDQAQSASKATLKVAFGDAFFVFMGVLILGVIWQWSAIWVANQAMAGAGALILPGPGQVINRVLTLGFSSREAPMFWAALAGSLGRALLGFCVAVVAATLLGIGSGLFRPLQQLLYPLVQLLRAVPVMSIILYLLLFVATDWVAVWVSFLIVFPLIYTNVVTGLNTVDLKLLEMAKLYRLSPWKQLRHIYLHAVMPYWLAACLTGMGLNIKAVITAEAMSLPSNSFGALMSDARNYLDTEGLLAITVWVILLAIALDGILLGAKWLLMKGRRTYVIYRRRA